jgi:hypothetical protein
VTISLARVDKFQDLQHDCRTRLVFMLGLADSFYQNER